ncbi:MAG: hypothetical protein ACE37K_11465 [Planctomycetota bacterium]
MAAVAASPPTDLCAARTTVQDPSTAKPASPRHARIVGFCCSKRPRQPLAGCKVTAIYSGAVEPGDDADLRRRPSVLAGEDGVFELDVLARPGVEVELRFEHPDCARDRYWAGSLRAGATYWCAFSCMRGVALRGVVRDGDGRPQKMAFDLVVRRRMRAGKGPTGPTPGWKPPPEPYPDQPMTAAPFCRVWWEERYGERIRVQSDEHGRFVVPERLWSSTVEVVPVDPALRPEPSRLLLTEESDQSVTLVVARRPYLAGRCVDQHGLPVEGVAMRLPRAADLDMDVVTGPDGTFVLPQFDGVSRMPRVKLYGCGDCEPLRATAELAWGEHDVVVPLRRWDAVPLRVVDADSGAPIERYAVRTWVPGTSWFCTQLRAAGRHRDGRLDVGVAAGPTWVAVVPEDLRWTCGLVSVHAAEGQAPLEVRLQRMVAMPLTIVDDDGLPVAGQQVQLALPANFSRHRLDVVWLRGERLSGMPDGIGELPWRAMSRATTDAEGRCVLLAPPGGKGMRVRVVQSFRQGRRSDAVVVTTEPQRVVVR